MTGIVIPDGGTIGSTSDTDAISIASSGNVTLSQTLDGGAIGSAVTMSANQACVKTALNASGNPPIFACRAFVNFDGDNAFSPDPSTSAIRSSGNVTSIAETASGRFQININSSTAFLNANYAVVGMTGGQSGASQNVGVSIENVNVSLPTTTMIPIVIRRRDTSTDVDSAFVSIACFA